MVVGFIGKSQTETLQAISVVSALTALKKRSVLVISLYNKSDISIEDILVGKKINAAEISPLGNVYIDSGIDALMSRVESERIEKEHFDTCCLQTLNSNGYVLDIANHSNKTSLESELLSKEEDLKVLFEAAQKNYDFVFCFIPENTKLQKTLFKMSDKIIVCVPQGKKKTIPAVNKKNAYILVCDYENNSPYSDRYLSKQYDIPAFTLKHNADLKNAYIGHDVLTFIMNNEKSEPFDDNFDFINSINRFCDALIGNMPERSIEEDSIPSIQENHQQDELKKLLPENVEEKTVTRGLFFRKKVKVTTYNESTVKTPSAAFGGITPYIAENEDSDTEFNDKKESKPVKSSNSVNKTNTKQQPKQKKSTTAARLQETTNKVQKPKYAEMTIAQLKVFCDERQLTYKSKSRKDELINMLVNYDRKENAKRAAEKRTSKNAGSTASVNKNTLSDNMKKKSTSSAVTEKKQPAAVKKVVSQTEKTQITNTSSKNGIEGKKEKPANNTSVKQPTKRTVTKPTVSQSATKKGTTTGSSKQSASAKKPVVKQTNTAIKKKPAEN